MQEPQGTDANSRSTTGVERLLQFQPLRRDIEAGHKLCNVIERIVGRHRRLDCASNKNNDLPTLPATERSRFRHKRLD